MTERADNCNSDRQIHEFVNLLIPNQRKILAFILSMVPNKSDAEDILQETLVKIWDKFDQFESGTDFVAWAVTIAKYKVFEFRRRTKDCKLQFRSELAQLLESESYQKICTMGSHISALQECTQKLQRKEVDLLKLRYEQDLTLKKIAERTGISIQAVHKTISRIHARLVRCMRLTLQQEKSA